MDLFSGSHQARGGSRSRVLYLDHDPNLLLDGMQRFRSGDACSGILLQPTSRGGSDRIVGHPAGRDADPVDVELVGTFGNALVRSAHGDSVEFDPGDVGGDPQACVHSATVTSSRELRRLVMQDRQCDVDGREVRRLC